MLKLEKSSQKSDSVVRVRLREKERLCEPSFLTALAIALSFHIGALLCFQVIPFSFSSTFTFPPIHVQSEQDFLNVSTIISYLPQNDDFLPPFPSLIPSLDWSIQEDLFSFNIEPLIDFNAFQLLEEKFWPTWQMPLNLELEEPRIKLEVSGELASIPLLSTSPLLNQLQPFSPQAIPIHLAYKVKLDEVTGEIFWFERLQASESTEINTIIEEIISTLKFDIKSQHDFFSGILHFTILN